ncbi:MAG: MarR family transcriptional regulator [Candidatus Bathyarchaeia archaeon]
MVDVEVWVFTIILAALTVAVCYAYYRQLQKVRKEYESAKAVVGDIVFSFNRQLKQEAERVSLIAYKVDAAASKGDSAKKAAEDACKKIESLEARVGSLVSEKEVTTRKVDEIAKALQESMTMQRDLAARLSMVEERVKHPAVISDAKIEAAIPIKREKALAPLTETEVSVLDMLASEGPKTAPEIKERIKLSREHTARLMKKLYEEGYLDRDTSRIPFKYSVKEEMRKLLKRTESEPAQQQS